MSSQHQALQSKKRPKKKLKYFLLGISSLAGILLFFHFAWMYSGSSRWEFLQEKDGIKVYSLKEPGATLKKFKAVTRIRSSLGEAVKIMQDPAFCDSVGCMESRMIEKVDDGLQYYYFKWEGPRFFKTRDFVVKSQFSQDPTTKAVLLRIVAVPDKMPTNPCCFRVSDMNNSWRFTPLGNGEIEVEYVVDTNQGGFIPYFLPNMAGGRFMHFVLSETKIYFDGKKDRYQNAEFDFLKEV